MSKEREDMIEEESNEKTIIKKYKDYWAVYDEHGEMICVTVYKKGAKEVKRRFDFLLSKLDKN
ncbi:hypothetical protein [Clostridiisalibacter paucivorans]|uniref:hypothetical protein n=1 Tax=Clostridiisalibacter paucivorans TaxID=408753 RepID=UPI00047C7DC1|nr:hypothetical protein [Clostridiisalibacter paucivorans]